MVLFKCGVYSCLVADNQSGGLTYMLKTSDIFVNGNDNDNKNDRLSSTRTRM
jgi:hypothetical protein